MNEDQDQRDGSTAEDDVSADGDRHAGASDGAGAARAAREASALRRVRRVSWLLDEAVRIPGTRWRVGLDPVLGIVPGAGDAVAAIIALYPVVEAYRLGASRWTLATMLATVGVDAVVGSVPVVGPVFDAIWKANERNRRRLERSLGASADAS